MGVHNASSKLPLKGRLPESLGLSLGVHALLFLVPTGVMMGHTAQEPQTSKQVFLIEAQQFANSPPPALPTPPQAHSTINDHDSETSKTSSDSEPEHNTDLRHDDPIEHLSSLEVPSSPTESPPPESFDKATPPKTPSAESTVSSTSNETNPLESASQAKKKKEPEPLTTQPAFDETEKAVLEATTKKHQIALDNPPPATLVIPLKKPETKAEKKPEIPDRHEFARARSDTEEMTPKETARISDKDMFAEKEQRAPVASTAEGSAELGVNAEAAKAGRPSTPGSPPSGQRGDKGEQNHTSTVATDTPADDTETVEAKGRSALGNPDENAGAPQSDTIEDEKPTTTGSKTQQAIDAKASQQAQKSTPGQQVKDGFLATESPTGDISLLLAARKHSRTQTETKAQAAQTGSVFSPGDTQQAPTPQAKLDTQQLLTDKKNRPTDDSTSTKALQLSPQGDGMAEVGDADNDIPYSSTYRAGKTYGAARLPSPGRRAKSATAPLTVAPDHIAIGPSTQVNARRTPLGEYVAQIEDEIRDTWVLPLELRAMGVQGNVEVIFTVNRRGRVIQKTISRHSGNTALDSAALDAVPPRLQRIPRALGQRQISFSYLFRTTDTIIAGSR